jgi:hypothetical protein
MPTYFRTVSMPTSLIVMPYLTRALVHRKRIEMRTAKVIRIVKIVNRISFYTRSPQHSSLLSIPIPSPALINYPLHPAPSLLRPPRRLLPSFPDR